MYFDVLPKRRREEFYNYDEQYSRLTTLLRKGHPLTVVLGVRRSGKTSLMSVVFNEIDKPKVWIDGRHLKDPKGEVPALIEMALKAGRVIYGEVEASVGVSIAGLELRLGYRERERPTPLEELVGGRELYLFIDEAQRAGKELGDVLAYLYDRVPGIRMVLSGSEVGVLERVLGFRDAESPLYGRVVAEVVMERLSPEKSLEFLRLGFRELGMRPPRRELEMVVERLDGLIGWLTMYGYRRAILGEKDALERTVEVAVEVVRRELQTFLKGRRNPRLCVEVLSLLTRPMRWKELWNGIRGRGVAESSFSHCLRELRDYGFIEKVGERYALADPILGEAVVGLV